MKDIIPSLLGQTDVVVKTVLYFRTDWKTTIGADVMREKSNAGFNLVLCESWEELSKSMSCNIDLILVHMNVIKESDILVPEFVNMISTLAKCSCKISTARIGVTIEKHATMLFLKELQSTEVAGIVPGMQSYGINRGIDAIKEFIRVGSHWPKTLINEFAEISTKKKSAAISLTVRQTQVATLICNRGLSNKSIANMLKISESTVKIHISAILKAYGVRNRTQLALAINSAMKP